MVSSISRHDFPSRRLLSHVLKKEMIGKFQRHLFGSIWIFLNPLLTSIVMITAFYGIFGVKRASLIDYSIYVLTGVVLVQFINASLINVSMSVYSARGLYSKIKIPKFTFPIAQQMLQQVNLLIGLLYVFLLVTFSGNYTIRVPDLVLSILSVTVFTGGLGLVFLVVNSYFPDFATILPIGLQAVMYLTPVFYTEEIWPEKVKHILALNPLLYFVRAFRYAIAKESTQAANFTVILVSSTLVLFFGLLLVSSNWNRVMKKL